MERRLSELNIGQEAVIKGFDDDVKAATLMEMGCLPGEKVSVVHQAPFGDPIAIIISGYKLSLRKQDAQCVVCEVGS